MFLISHLAKNFWKSFRQDVADLLSLEGTRTRSILKTKTVGGPQSGHF
jgi:hypothetical protein